MNGPTEFDARLDLPAGGGAVVRVRGDLDMATAPLLEEAIAPVEHRERLVIDLTECSFVDSAALRVLTRTARDLTEHGGTLALVVTDPGILRILEITAVDTMLPVHSSVDAAL